MSKIFKFQTAGRAAHVCMALLSNIYTNIIMLSSTSAVVFFKANRRADSAQVLIKLFRTQEDSDGSTRMKTIISFTELLTVTSIVLGTVSAVREIDAGFMIEYIVPSHATIQSLSDYLRSKRSLMVREGGRRVSNSRSSSRLNSKSDGRLETKSSGNCNTDHDMSNSCAPNSLGLGAWCTIPRYSRQVSKSRSIRQRGRATSVSTEWRSISATIDSWQERVVWQLIAQLVQALSDFYKTPDALRAGITPNICPESVFIITDPCAPSNLELTVLACILDPHMHMPIETSIYRAPELFRNVAKEPAADIWALGCIAFELIAQRKPRFDPTKLVRDPVLQNIDCSPDLLEFITSCCRFNPQERPCIVELMRSRIIRAVRTHMFSAVQTKSELTLVNQLDLTRINMRRICMPEGKYFRPTYSEVPTSLASQSESSDSISITEILDIHSSSTGLSAHPFPSTHYAANVREDILGKQTITWKYDTPGFSLDINEYISKRQLLSFFLLPDALDIINKEALNLVPFLTSFEAIKQLCDLSFDGIALELERELTTQERDYLLCNLDIIWSAILNVSYMCSFLLKNNYFIERIISEIDTCASWVTEKNNAIAAIKTELYCISTVLFGLYSNDPQDFCACFLVNNDRCNSILSIAFDINISKLVASILTEGRAPPFVITEAYQSFNCSMLRLTARLDTSNPAELGGHVLLLINLSRELLYAINKQPRLIIDPSNLIPLISTIKILLPKSIAFKLLIQHLTNNLLSVLSLLLLQELDSSVYSPTSPTGVVLNKLFSYISVSFEDLLKQRCVFRMHVLCYDTIQLIMLLDQTCQVFMLLAHIQRRHLMAIGIEVCADIFINNCALRGSPSISEGEQQPSTSEFITDYVGQLAYIGLGTPDSWVQAKSNFKEAFSSLQGQFLCFSNILIPSIAQLTLDKDLSSLSAIQFSLCRLRGIFLDLELQSSLPLPLGQMLLESSFFSKLQHYLIVFTQNNDGKSLSIVNFKRKYPEIVYLLSTAKRLLYLTLGKTDSDMLRIYITNNLQGRLYEYLGKLKQDILTATAKVPSVDLDLAKTFVQTFA